MSGSPARGWWGGGARGGGTWGCVGRGSAFVLPGGSRSGQAGGPRPPPARARGRGAASPAVQRVGGGDGGERGEESSGAGVRGGVAPRRLRTSKKTTPADCVGCITRALLPSPRCRLVLLRPRQCVHHLSKKKNSARRPAARPRPSRGWRTMANRPRGRTQIGPYVCCCCLGHAIRRSPQEAQTSPEAPTQQWVPPMVPRMTSQRPLSPHLDC